jgi:hypothetical protein
VAEDCKPCTKLESGFGPRCVFVARESDREKLGCGDVADSGQYGIVVTEKGSMDDEDWSLEMRYVDATGKTVRKAPGCADEPGFDCEAPGRFLPIADGQYLHRQGNAGDGTNDNAILDLAENKRHRLPEGEYAVVIHPERPVLGFAAVVPNYSTDEGEPAVQVVLGCFALETAKLQKSKARLVGGEQAIDAILEIDLPTWKGSDLMLAPKSGKPFRLACKAAA